MNVSRTVPGLLLVLVLAGPALALDAGQAHEEAMQCLKEKRYEDAIRAYAPLLRENPHDPVANYNVACACSLLGKTERAMAFLERAVEGGYLDFEHMKRDPDLAPLKALPAFERILADREGWLRRADAKTEARYRNKLGDAYAYLRDDDYKILLITNVDDRTREKLLRLLRAWAEALWRDFFEHRPTRTIVVLVPASWKDYATKFGGRRGAAGFYNHGTRTLTVNLETGAGTMIHEFTHALHYADQEGLKQRHPIWIVEGFGSLFEQCRILPDGKPVGLPNWRLTRHLRPALRSNPEAYLPWKKVMDPASGVFRNKETVGMAYAVARYIFYFLQEKGKLRTFYRRYRKQGAQDPTGAGLIEEIFDKPLSELEAEWKTWVLSIQYGGAPAPRVRLGVHLEAAEGGVEVTQVVEGSCAKKAGVRAGDVITSLDGHAVASIQAVLGVLRGAKPGDRIRIEVRRGAETLVLEGTLQKR